MAKEQIINRIENIRNNLYTPSDLLSITLKVYRKLKWKLSLKIKRIQFNINEGDKILDMEDMIDDFITFFVAGQETTANALAFCFLELARNPLVVQKYIKLIIFQKNKILK